jgi:hypothetical protein
LSERHGRARSFKVPLNLRGDCARHVAGIEAAEAIDGNDAHLEALLLQEPAGADNRRVLHRAGDDVCALSP